MTAPGPLRPTTGSAALAGRPAGALWVLLLIGFLVGLPCAGTAHAAAATTAVTTTIGAAEHHAQPEPQPTGARSAHPAPPAASPLPPLTLCTADDPVPPPGDGCSNLPFCSQDAQLPNAPPHPEPAAPPQLVTFRAMTTVRPAGSTPGTATAPDLHLLQVNRT
ncbi:hypothetical protein P3T36_005336 [Kitasatospora sp. MAP12-15]|uniref:hypothetical protein n=1 Tax=unclassified Kitasatospora TaxID=2633591 RepID=UPI002473E664|nr:hypothetical protein [Kitasatospora sp. MAP12-44]MDH6109863.1 hypothetical protein [Kitasatospora sp. MAP12-44]